MMSDQEIVKGCRNKDRLAQKSLYDRYSGLLLGICIRYATDVPEAEDILQESLVKVYMNIGDFTGEGSFIGWMRKIVINTAITHYHKHLKHKHYVEIEEVYTSEAGKSDIPDTPYTAEELMKILDQLPPGYRTVFNLYAVEGYKHKEIAIMLDIDVNTSKSQYSRARSFIQKKLENYK
ncbi:MAG: RNA polymerase sigma factor [Marinilabiliaceae bacterium]|jgi:RNA polymerase sigma-70 factor (ECF subfamily)|nr:RNA polymerase sigma factor [Marinilabiliaceae bacterium]